MKNVKYFKTILLLVILIVVGSSVQAQCDYTDGFNQKAATTEYGSTEEILDGWTFYCCRHLANKVVVYIGNGMDENVGYIKTPVYSGGCDAISFSIRMLYSTSGCLKIDIVQNGEVVWSDNISDIPTSAAGYTDYSANGLNIKGDFQVVFTANGSWTLENPCGGMVYANASESPIMIKNICIKKIPIIPPHNFQFNVPKDATVYVGDKDQTVTVAGNYLTKHYVPFTKKDEVFIAETDTSKIWYYNLPSPKNASGGFNYRVTRAGKAPHVGLFKPKTGTTVESDTLLVFTDTQLSAHNAKDMDHDVNSLNGRNVADVFININAQGYLTLPLQADTTFQLIHTRNWQAIDTDVNNYFIEPDFHYTVVDENGLPSNSVITVSDSGLITPVGAGTAIVLVDYDAMLCHHTTNVGISNVKTNPAFFSALWPENTAVFVVAVNAPATGIKSNMLINEYWSELNGTDKVDSTLIDAELDVLYYESNKGSFPYTFKPEGVTGVEVATPTVGTSTLSYSGFATDSVTANSDGSYTVRLSFGRNIVKLNSATGAEYQVITAKPVDYTVSNITDPGQAFQPGDSVSVLFNTLYHPCNKMSGIYNMSSGIQYTGADVNFPLILGPGQYTFASRAQGYKIRIPDTITSNNFDLTQGVLKVKGFGSNYGAHRNISIQSGVAPNLSASVRTGYFGALPNINIKLNDNSTGITNTTAINNITIYPNPFKDYIIINTSTDNNIIIYDLSGNIVMKQNIKEGSNYINTSTLYNGIYLLKCGMNILKIIK
ncbi:MAG: T9SS type A sorting domain-containing protein [Bacteroidales bacterium]|nr:T9SS type A sorting domain-containing protein [Bacteroidales bacterium]